MTDGDAGGEPHQNSLDNPDQREENANVAAAGRQRETHMGFARMLATFAFILALPIALLTTNIRLLANAPAVYDYAFDRFNAEDATGLSRADLDSTAGALRRYFNNDEKTFYHTVTEGGLAGPVFNARETRHMEDVKRLFSYANLAQELSVVYVIAYVVSFFVWAREGNVRQLGGPDADGRWGSARCLSAWSADSPPSDSARHSTASMSWSSPTISGNSIRGPITSCRCSPRSSGAT